MAKPQAAADTDTVGVADNAAGSTIEIAQQKIGGFSSNTGNSEQFLHGIGYFAL